MRVHFIEGKSHDGDIMEFGTEDLPDDFRVSYAEFVIPTERTTFGKFFEKGAYLVKDVTRDFMKLCGKHILSCAYKINPKKLESKFTMGKLVLYENMNHTLLTSLRTRQKRDLVIEGMDTVNTTDGCKVRPWHVKLTEIGMDFVVAPESFYCNICSGKCRINKESELFTGHALVKSFYSSSVHGDVEPDEKLCVHCSPTEYEPLTMVYITKHDTVAFKRLRGAIVKSCGCL